MIKELRQLLNDLYMIKDGIVSWLEVDNVENKITSLESAIEILEKLRNGGKKKWIVKFY